MLPALKIVLVMDIIGGSGEINVFVVATFNSNLLAFSVEFYFC